jgi:hypothetical protein
MDFKEKLLLILLILFSYSGISQTTYITRDSIHIGWQPNVSLNVNDYKGDKDQKKLEKVSKFNITALASTGIWSILDIPEKIKNRGKLLEIAYFAPFFETSTSFYLTNDTLQIQKQNMYFDIHEISARWARKQLAAIQDKVKAYGTIHIMYEKVKQEMEELDHQLCLSYTGDVFINNKDGAFKKWRENINVQLKETEQWATTPKDCHRLLLGKPIEKGYIKAPNIISFK